MKKAIEQDTLATMIETCAAWEFRVLRDGKAWRPELRLGSKWLPRYWRSLTAERF